MTEPKKHHFRVDESTVIIALDKWDIYAPILCRTLDIIAIDECQKIKHMALNASPDIQMISVIQDKGSLLLHYRLYEKAENTMWFSYYREIK